MSSLPCSGWFMNEVKPMQCLHTGAVLSYRKIVVFRTLELYLGPYDQEQFLCCTSVSLVLQSPGRFLQGDLKCTFPISNAAGKESAEKRKSNCVLPHSDQEQ